MFSLSRGSHVRNLLLYPFHFPIGLLFFFLLPSYLRCISLIQEQTNHRLLSLFRKLCAIPLFLSLSLLVPLITHLFFLFFFFLLYCQVIMYNALSFENCIWIYEFFKNHLINFCYTLHYYINLCKIYI